MPAFSADTAAIDPLHGWPLSSGAVDVGAETIELHVIDQDFVIDRLVEENADLEQRNPYFGLVWPAAVALARDLAMRDDLAGRSLLDLGCGPGLLGIVAARRGARVTFADLMPEGVELARRNAARCGVAGEFVRCDLRDETLPLPRFDRIVASDVLYERPLVGGMLDALDNLLADDGLALLSDPMRPTAHDFAHRAARAGFAVEEGSTTVRDDGKDVAVRMIRVARRTGPVG